MKYKDETIFFFYCIEERIITKEEIVQWADRRIIETSSPEYFLIQLSLSKSLEEQFFILNSYIPRDSFNYNNISFRSIIYQINKLYKPMIMNVLLIIDRIYHVMDKVCLEKDILNEIYILDDKKDLYLSGIISLEELEKQADEFLIKYLK